MRALWGKIDHMLSADSPACLITLVEARGSTPRNAGARLVISAQGQTTGTIGGGALEWQAMARAQKLMQAHPDGIGRHEGEALGPSLGQCCGGAVRLRYEVLVPSDRDWIASLAEAEQHGAFTTHGKVDDRGVLVRTLAPADRAIIETFGDARTPILLFGAGHTGRALVLALAPLPFSVSWIDPRKSEFPGVFPANVTPYAPDDPLEMLDLAPKGACVLVLTHSHALDLALVAKALRMPHVAFVGVIGSETKRARFLSHLKASGYSDAACARLTCPIGEKALGKEPAILAAGIAVQLLKIRRAMQQTASLPSSKKVRHGG